MLRKSTKIIVLLIVAEILVLGAIAIFQMRSNIGPAGSTKLAEAPIIKGVATATAFSSQPEPVDAATPVPSPSTAGAQSNAPGSLAAPTPTLLPINVVSPSPTPPSGRNVAPTSPPLPLVQSGPSSKSSRIVIRALGLDSPVVEMGYTIISSNGQETTDWQVPQFAVGHMIGSANPGALGNVVLSAHNNIYGSLFRKLYTLQPGDQLTLFNTSGTGFLYRVVQSYIVQEEGAGTEQRLANARVLLPTLDARATLISCWPEDNNTGRAIVIAELVGRGK